MKKSLSLYLLLIICITLIEPIQAADWPVYKGNIYYTGNNDEVTVKNNNLKWLFQASEMAYNPIVSDGMVYFIDMKKIVYCLDEDTGKLIWKIDLRQISSQFYSYSKAMGKVKYPLIKDNWLFLTDNIAIYCINKKTGHVLWARTGVRDEKEITKQTSWLPEKTNKWQPGMRDQWDPTKTSKAIVDGIYSNPVIIEDMIYYGTRNVFISREIKNGHLIWNNSNIKSYSGFPSFYDEYIFTQSMDYMTQKYSLYCMYADTGKVKWIKNIAKPHQIFSPVIYKGNVYLASGKSIYCFSLKDGERVWEKQYSNFITSNPSFTEREILFTVGNRNVTMINPANGKEMKSIDLGEQASPYFVTIRDQIYIANTFKKNVSGRELSYASLKAIKFDQKGKLWEFIPPFPGGAHQPAASNGIMFLPAGNYLYAVGTDYYPRIIKGGSANYDPYNKGSDDSIDKNEKDLNKKQNNKDKQLDKDKNKDKNKIIDQQKNKDKLPEKIPMRKMKITTSDNDNTPIPATIEIKKWKDGKIIYSDRIKISKPNQVVDVPDMDDVEITGSADGYIPKKVIVSKKDDDKNINLEKIEKGKGIVVDNIHFEFNEAYLKKESLNILDRMIESMKKNKNIRLEVRGHTDSIGSGEYNQKLSERRADAVTEYMIKNGISPERLEAVGFGEDKPIANNSTEEGRRKNRRTEFFILNK